MAKLGDLVVAIGANTRDLDKALGKSMRKIKNFGKNTKQMGKSLTMNVTAPIAALGFTAVKAFQQQAKAIAQVEAGLKSTGGQVGYTSQQLQQMASDLQTKTLFGDEQILQDATAQLLTFTNISGEQFARTQQAALDLATRLDGDLKGASIQLGKALNDPVANLSALSRSGIQFSEEQKEVIKSMAESGRLAEAQTLILDELNNQYGGSAEAAAKADGGFTQLANSFGDLQEEFGKILVDVLQPVVDFLKNVVSSLQNASPEFKQMAVTISLVAAAIGPLLMVLPMLVQGFMLLTGPIGLTIAAVGLLVYAIYTFAEEVSKPIADVVNYFITLYNESDSVRMLVGYVKEAFIQNFKIIWNTIKTVVDLVMDLGGALMKLITGDFSGAFDDFKQGWADAFDSIVDQAVESGQAIADSINAELAKDPIELISPESVQKAIETFGGLTDKFNAMMSGGGGGGDISLEARPKDMATMTMRGATDTGERGLMGITDPKLLKARADEAAAIHQQAIDDAEQRDSGYQNSVMQLAGTLQSTFSSLFTGLINGTQTFGDFMKQILMDLLVKLASMTAAFLVIAAITGGAGVGTTAGTFGDFLKGGFNIPKLASGGIASGPTLAMVGEYSGASTNPEVIAPLDKLQSMMGSAGGNVTVTGRISGRDILLSNERANFERNRTRGF
jgi:hypothetical protein